MKGVLHTWLWLLGLALAYFASGQLGLTVPYLGAFVSLIWPPTGVAVAALWRGGLSRWPGVWLGSLAINLASGGTPLMSVAIACGNTLAPLLTVWALRRVGASLHFDTRRDMNHYLLAISGGMLASASVGTLSLWLSGVMQPAQLPKIFLIWWAGDAVGALLLGIPLLTFVPRLWRELSPTRRLEGLGCLAGMLMIGQLLLYSPSHAALLPLVFIPFLLLSWLAVRTGLMLSSLAVLLLSALMAWGTVQGMGPFHRPSVHEGLALLWGYMATLMVVALLLSALVAELSANERRWQFALEGADTGVWDWHARSQRIQYSPRWRMLLGVSAAELGNKLTGWETRVHPDDLPAFIAVLAGREQPASSHELRPHGSEIRLRAGNGQWRWYGLRSQVVSRDRDGAPSRVIGTLTDITRYKDTLYWLKLLERALHSARNGVIISDVRQPDQPIIYVNDAFERTTGYRREEVLGRNCRMLNQGDREQPGLDALRTAMAAGKSCQTVLRNYRKDGSLFWNELSIAPVYDERQQLTHYIGVQTDISAQILAQERLSARDKLLHKLSEQAPGLICQMHMDGKRLSLPYASEAIREVFGLSPEDVREDASPLCRVLHPDDRLRLYRGLHQAARQQAPWRDEFRVELQPGQPEWREAHAMPEALEDGSVLWYGYVADISERKAAMLKLEEGSAFYQAMFETNNAVKLLVDPARKQVVDANPAASAFYGYPHEVLVGMPISQINTATPEHIRAALACAQATGQQRFEFVHRLADGSTRDVEVYSGPIRLGGRELLFSIIHDISERKRAEEQLRFTASVFEHAHEGIMITDANAQIVDVNRTFTEITGYAREDVLGRSPNLLRSGYHSQAFYSEMWAALYTEGYWRGEVWNRRKNGEVYPELLTISSVRPPDGRVTHYVAVFSDITVLKEHQQKLERMAHYDALTQLPNRVLLADRLMLALTQARRSGKLLAVCYLDLDGFKPVNDTFGHEAGDALLVEVASRLKQVLRNGDTVARLGGDEFVLLLSGLDDIGKCQQALDRVLHTIAQPYQLGKERLANLSASIGVTLYPVDGADADTLLRHADQAMYLAKQAGRHRYHLFDPEHDRQAHAHREAVARIEAALNAGEFRLYYQPKVNMRHGVVVGAEALIRWQHPERGLLPPGEFLPIIEDSEFSVELGEWVMEEALRQMAVWRAQGLTLPVSVNISARHLQHPQFSQRLHTLLARHPDTPPGQLELEVLETAALDDIAYVSALMERCRALGVMFALDDFGTGYSSLTYLKRLPANVLKIDQSFVRDMLKDPEDLAIIEGVIGLTQAFRRTAIAEGVETLEHGALLIQLGCDLGQGYGIARPMPAEAVPSWVAGFSAPESWRRAGLHPWSRDDFPLLGASIDHQHWIEELVQCLEQDTSHCPPPLDIHHCRFGRWYHGPGQDRYGQLPAFRVIDASHHQVHELASQLHAAHLAGELARVRAGIPELYALRDQMLAQLDALRRVVASRSGGQDMGGL